MKKITKKTKISQIVKKYPYLVDFLIKKYGFHCFGCFAAAFETLEEGAKAHLMEEKEIDKMIEQLNERIEKENEKRTNRKSS